MLLRNVVSSVSALLVFSNPEPSRLLNDEPLTTRFVVEAYVAENSVDDEFVNVCRAVQMLALVRFSPMVRAVDPLYVPENERVLSVAVRSARLEPSAIPEIVELVRPALFSVPDTVGVKVNAPALGTIV